jgi:hypothetical protein
MVIMRGFSGRDDSADLYPSVGSHAHPTGRLPAATLTASELVA